MKNFNLKRDFYPILILIIGTFIMLWNSAQVALNNLLLGLAIYAGFYLITLIDPLKENYNRFQKIILLIRDILITFFVAFNLIEMLSTQGYITKSSKAITILVSLLITIIGNYLPTFKRNWFIGIKTPWTMSNEDVWNRTHRFGGKLFVIAGLVSLIGSLFTFGAYILFISLMVATLSAGIYSYWIHTKLEKDKTDQNTKWSSKKTKLLLAMILSIIIIFAIIFIPHIKNVLNLPIPDSISQIEAFIQNHPEYTLKPITSFNFGEYNEPQTFYVTKIQLNNTPVKFIVAQFSDSAQAREFFVKNKTLKQGHIKIKNVEINLPNSLSYWSTTVKGNKIISWQKRDWVIIIEGENSESVKELCSGFKSWLVN